MRIPLVIVGVAPSTAPRRRVAAVYGAGAWRELGVARLGVSPLLPALVVLGAERFTHRWRDASFDRAFGGIGETRSSPLILVVV